MSRQLSEGFRRKYKDRHLPMPQAEVYLVPEFLTVAETDDLLEVLQQKAAWRQEKIKLFGRQIDQPRLTAWYADAGKAYTYSGLTWYPEPWLPELSSLRQKLEQETGVSFNSVLLNLYRHGQDSMGWHADDEPELGKNPVIASVSLGADRVFSFRHRQQQNLKQKLVLPSGSLLLMAGETQYHWQHQLAKSTQAMEARVNPTFRFIY